MVYAWVALGVFLLAAAVLIVGLISCAGRLDTWGDEQ